jgi:hypothetical protein
LVFGATFGGVVNGTIAALSKTQSGVPRNFWNGDVRANGASTFSMRNSALLQQQGWVKGESGRWTQISGGDMQYQFPDWVDANGVFRQGGTGTATIPTVENIAAKEVGNAFSLTKYGELTNGVYTVSKEAMKKHVFDLGQGKSIFYPSLNAEEAVLKAAQYADEAGLWIGNKAKVPVLNTNIGRLGNGSPTNFINVYRNSNGFIHGSPGTIR